MATPQWLKPKVHSQQALDSWMKISNWVRTTCKSKLIRLIPKVCTLAPRAPLPPEQNTLTSSNHWRYRCKSFSYFHGTHRNTWDTAASWIRDGPFRFRYVPADATVRMQCCYTAVVNPTPPIQKDGQSNIMPSLLCKLCLIRFCSWKTQLSASRFSFQWLLHLFFTISWSFDCPYLNCICIAPL